MIQHGGTPLLNVVLMQVMSKVGVDLADDGADDNRGTELFTTCIDIFKDMPLLMLTLSIFIAL